MQYEIPNSVMVAVSSRDTQLTFARRALMKAARKAGLPLLEQTAYAHFIYPLSTNDLLFKMRWAGKDPSLFDDSRVKDWEFSRRAIYELNDTEKEELRIRQIYYVLKGGVLGSMSETKNSDTIIVDLNIVYEEKQFNEAKARETLKNQVADAENVYGKIEIKFYITWTAGTGDVKKGVITKGRKEGFINAFLSIGEGGASSYLGIDKPDPTTGEIKTYDILLTREKFTISGMTNNSMNNWAISHELGHKFGITAFYDLYFAGYEVGNVISDIAIDAAILRARTGSVVKGVDWGRSPYVRSILQDLGPTTFDLLRAGANKLARKR